jgi:hypothetical protein
LQKTSTLLVLRAPESLCIPQSESLWRTGNF